MLQKWVSLGLYSRSSCLKHVATRQFKRNSIWACCQVGAAGSDPMLNKISTFKDACWKVFEAPYNKWNSTRISIYDIGIDKFSEVDLCLKSFSFLLIDINMKTEHAIR
ncbi:hypothetical protein CRYUN_Cryun16bG0090600 [Craigia yunnanensis]